MYYIENVAKEYTMHMVYCVMILAKIESCENMAVNFLCSLVQEIGAHLLQKDLVFTFYTEHREVTIYVLNFN